MARFTKTQLDALSPKHRARINAVRKHRARKAEAALAYAREALARHDAAQPPIPADLAALVPAAYAHHGLRCRRIYAGIARELIASGRPFSTDTHGALLLAYAQMLALIEALPILRVPPRYMNGMVHLWRVLKLGDLHPSRPPRAGDRRFRNWRG